MTLPPEKMREAEAQLGALIARRRRPEMDTIHRLGFRFRGNAVTLYEENKSAFRRDEWVQTVVAQFRYRSKENAWILHWADRNSRWHEHEMVGSRARLRDLVDEVDRDPTGILWG